MSRNVSSYNQVWVQCNSKMALIANLNDMVSQVRLDLAFGQGDLVSFCNNGDSDVHLTGYYLLDYEDKQEEGAFQRDLSNQIQLHCQFCFYDYHFSNVVPMPFFLS